MPSPSRHHDLLGKFCQTPVVVQQLVAIRRSDASGAGNPRIYQLEVKARTRTNSGLAHYSQPGIALKVSKGRVPVNHRLSIHVLRDLAVELAELRLYAFFLSLALECEAGVLREVGSFG
jgi:hypothetical protein